MKNALRRIGAILLTLAMMATMLPIFSMTASAAGTLSVSDSKIGLSWTDASNSSGKASWTASGTTITGTATGYKALSVISRSITTKLTITNNYTDTRKLSFSYTLTGGGSVSGISGNAYSGDLAAGASLTITLTSPSGTSTNTLTITNIQLIGNSNVTATFLPVEGGSYTVNGTAITAETSYTKAPTESSYTVAATANSGYAFYGWYNETSGTYMSYDAGITLPVGSDATIKPVFVAGNPAHFTVGGKRFYDLSEAVASAQAGSDKKIVVAKDGTVTGTHTIPSGITLLVPYNDANSVHGKNPSCTSYDDLLGGKGSVAWVTPTRYRTLTLGADAHITLNGVIEVGGQHASAAGGSPHNGRYGGSPTGPLGFINMLAGSHIDVNNGATLYAWGYIYGDGTITAKSGAAIYENFQIMDFRGGDKSTELAQGFLVFPTAQYHVQNIEVATRYEYGSTEYVHTSVYMSRMEHGATVQFIGSNAMFRPQPGSYVVKDYDPATDSLYLDSYGDCALSELAMSIAGVDVDAGQFVLPITNNMQIRIKTGTATLQQNVMMLPGSSITVDQGATLNLAYTDATTDVVTAGGYILQMFDYTNYTYGIDMDTFEVVTGRYYNYWDRSAGMRTRPVPFTCTERKVRTESDLVDAKLDINGTVISNGFIYSTVDYADILNEDYTITGGGANICSSEGTGTIQMVNGAGGDVFGVMYDQNASTDGIYYYIPLASAQLKNGDGSLVDTTGAEAGTVYEYCAEHDCWACDQDDPCAAGHSYDNACDTDCNVCGEGREITHSYNAVVTAPDCVNGGYTTYTCSVCGDSYVGNKTAELGHKYDNACDTECNVCGEGREITHSYVGEETLAPTCGEVGEMTYTCSVCGDNYTEEIAATGAHEYNYACEQFCKNCGEKTNPSAKCSRVYHEAVPAVSCIEYGTKAYYQCEYCGVVSLDANGIRQTNLMSIRVAGDCISDAEHACQDGNCINCSLPVSAEADHEYDHEYDVNCNVCGEIREIASPISYIGKSVSEDVSGLAMLFQINVEGIVVKEGTFVQADFTNATYNSYKLLGVGVVASNGVSETTIKGERMYDLEEDVAKFAFRIINIPADKLDVAITMTPYYTVEVDGAEIMVITEAEAVTYSYNSAVTAA